VEQLGRDILPPAVSTKLAIDGGAPVRQAAWPPWPVADERTEAVVRDVLYSTRWTLSGNTPTGVEPFETRFARAFAEYNRVRYCVPVSSGSVSLVVALRALGLGVGDEVVVPALTWVGCASSVLATGAIPVFADIDPETLAMDPDAAADALTSRTAAILLVHPYCTLANLDAFVELAARADVPLVEDCSQAHGARWNGRNVGTFGAIGTFSMHETKVLTCGEGGAAITDDDELFDRMSQVRADGRTYARHRDFDQLALEDAGDVLGHNFCLSEFHAAILDDRLRHLDGEIETRERNGAMLRTLLEEVEGVSPLARPPAADVISYWRFVARLDLDAFGGWPLESVCEALAAELRIFVIPVDPAIVDSDLYKPLTSIAAKSSPEIRRRLDVGRYNPERAREAARTALRIPHRVLLGSEADVGDIAAAFRKVQDAAVVASRDAVGSR
jgi:dTDP-4-amino-4,6-dideoxygalactose transaminase